MDRPPFNPELEDQDPQWTWEPSLELVGERKPVAKIPLPPRPLPRPRRRWLRVFLALVVLASIGLFVWAWYPRESLKDALARQGLKLQDLARDRRNVWLRVYKSDKRLELRYRDQVVKTYRVSTGPGWPQGSKPRETSDLELMGRMFFFFSGDKMIQNDLRTPEGKYSLVTGFGPSNDNYRFALLSYPDPAHRRRSSRPGNDVGIHGMGQRFNWLGRLHTLVWHTRGCVALTDGEVDELAQVAGRGTRVEILP